MHREWAGQTIRKLTGAALALLIAIPTFPRAGAAPPAETHQALHLMNDSEFALFLKRLDQGVLRWKAQLRNVDVKSVDLEQWEAKELERSYSQCLQALDNTREEIQKLSQKQNLKLDFLLLVDLNELARSLDGLNRDLANPVTVGGSGTARKSLAYAREILGIYAALAPHIAEFQQHVLAFAAVVDATLDRAEQDTNHTHAQKPDLK